MMTLSNESIRILGKIKHLREEEKILAREKDTMRWREEMRSYAAELASELLRLYPDIPPLA